MRTLKHLRHLLLFLFRGFHNPSVVRRPAEPKEPEFSDDLPPGYVGIETQIRGQHIDGSSRWVGEDARVIQAPNGEIVTLERGRTVRCGCGHLVSSLEEIRTETGMRAGIGGICPYCLAEVQERLIRNEISAHQADALQLYCTRCASRCEDCGRHDLCAGHTLLFQHIDGRKHPLCPECLQKATRVKRLNKAIAFANWLFAEDDVPKSI